MNINELCASLGRSLPSMFQCSPAPHEGVRVRTPMLYPDGGVVDVFVLERGSGYLVTDFGDALGWLGIQSVSRQRSPKQQVLIRDVCQTLRIQLDQDQLVVRSAEMRTLAESVLRLAQAAVRVSDIWFTFRSQSLLTTAEEVDEWLHEKEISFQRRVARQGRSQKSWTVDFEILTEGRSAFVFLLSTGSRSGVNRITEHVFTGCMDLSHLRDNQSGLTFISLFDDIQDVWQAEDFNLLSEVSEIAMWSRPDEFELLLRTAPPLNSSLC